MTRDVEGEAGTVTRTGCRLRDGSIVIVRCNPMAPIAQRQFASISQFARSRIQPQPRTDENPNRLSPPTAFSFIAAAPNHHAREVAQEAHQTTQARSSKGQVGRLSEIA